MKQSVLKSLLIAGALAVFGLCCLGAFEYGSWITILEDDFDHCRVEFNIIEAEVGYFYLEDPYSIIEPVFDAFQNGVIRFQDQVGNNAQRTALFGYPREEFFEIRLVVEFDLVASQDDSSMKAVLTDDDDLDVFLCSMGDNGNWFINGQDLQIPYQEDVTYTVNIFVEVDPSGGPTLFAVIFFENGSPSFEVLDTGVISDFHYGDKIKNIRFEKPALSPAGTFYLDNVLMQYSITPECGGQSGNLQMP